MRKTNPYIILLILQSCIITRTPGFYSGYDRLTEREKQNIIFTNPDADICNLSNDRNIYAITGIQLRACIESRDKVIVYHWTPNCSSRACFPLKTMQDYSTKKGYHLFAVARYYDSERMFDENRYLTDSPLFSVNEVYYETKYCNKYDRLFFNNLLLGQNTKKEDFYSTIFIFDNGILVGTSSDEEILEEIQAESLRQVEEKQLCP